jgi:hypothetical protein
VIVDKYISPLSFWRPKISGCHGIEVSWHFKVFSSCIHVFFVNLQSEITFIDYFSVFPYIRELLSLLIFIVILFVLYEVNFILIFIDFVDGLIISKYILTQEI